MRMGRDPCIATTVIEDHYHGHLKHLDDSVLTLPAEILDIYVDSHVSNQAGWNAKSRKTRSVRPLNLDDIQCSIVLFFFYSYNLQRQDRNTTASLQISFTFI